jgi:hypothetical protein
MSGELWKEGASSKFVELPIVKDYKRAEQRLENYLDSRRNNTTSPDSPDDWINNVRNGNYENVDWPAIEGGVKDPVAVADLFANMRREIRGLKKREHWECAQILYKYIPSKYEYIAGYREFWTLLAVYVVPEWPYLNYPEAATSDGVKNDRYALKGSTAVRDALAQYWWKYHILKNALERTPTAVEWNSIASDVWQERTNLFKNQEVVRALAAGTALQKSSAKEAAKSLGKYLYIYDAGSLDMDAVLVKDPVSPEGLTPTAARLKINVERDNLADGLRKVRSPDRLNAYEAALKNYLFSGVLPDLATDEGAALLALAALAGYRLNRQEWRIKGVEAGSAVNVLEAWRSDGADYVFEVIKVVRGTLPAATVGKAIRAGHGDFKVGDLYTRTEIMAAGLASFEDKFKHWAEGSWTLGDHPLLVGNQNPEKYPGESLDRAKKTVTVHSEKGARETNSGKRYLDKPTLLFWRDPTGQFEFLGLGSYASHTAGPNNNMLLVFNL